MDRARVPPQPATQAPFAAVAVARLDRRDVLAGLSALAALCTTNRALGATRAGEPRATDSTFTFREVPHGADEHMHVAKGHSAHVLLAWGDPLFEGDGPFAPRAPSRASQERRFGTENDFIAFLPLPKGSQSSRRGLLCVNHEGSALHHMFEGVRPPAAQARAGDDDGVKPFHLEIEMAAQGHSIVEIERVEGRWRAVRSSPFNRRIHAETTIEIAGPAAGHERLRTSDDPTGRRVLGTFNCCSGGVTPWGTVLVGEENFNKYFTGDPGACGAEARNHTRCDVGRELEFHWHRIAPRFDLAREPREPNRHGWVVEIDPFDPASTPKKRTALGRFKHEAATCALDPSGRVVVYMGDDDEDEHVYKFVTRGTFDPTRPEAARDLLDDGDLYVARFDADGTVAWLLLRHGEGPLTKENGFASQADVLVEARLAATFVGATPMDRPEDVEASPTSGRVYVMLTNNKRRGREHVDAANPRWSNVDGHVVEMIPPANRDGAREHAATTFRWELFLLAGNPFESLDESFGAQRACFHPATSRDGWLACPDNCTFDPRGRLWIATDGAAKSHGTCDGLFATDVFGAGRALTRQFFRAPLGAEICGPCFTPDGTTLFLSVQHPGEARADGSTNGVGFSAPTTRFPDFDDDLPPRSCVVAISKDDGGVVGS